MNYLAKNIRFLRKERQLSQQQFADALGIKRSNVAAYETKNVEPRLSLIYEMANYFGVSLTDFVVVDLARNDRDESQTSGGTEDGLLLTPSEVNELDEEAYKAQRMLDGFKVFYEYKQTTLIEERLDEGNKGDIENFLTFIDHMLAYNRKIRKALSTEQVTEGAVPTAINTGGQGSKEPPYRQAAAANNGVGRLRTSS